MLRKKHLSYIIYLKVYLYFFNNDIRIKIFRERVSFVYLVANRSIGSICRHGLKQNYNVDKKEQSYSC